MKRILKDVIRGASTQFGREFGRAGANAVLKGANSYNVNITNVDIFEGRIKPSDHYLVKTFKEMNKIKYVQTNKANVNRLIALLDEASPIFEFNNMDTLNNFSVYLDILRLFNYKFNEGLSLIDDNYSSDLYDEFKNKAKDFKDKVNIFDNEMETFVKNSIEVETKNKKTKEKAARLSLYLVGLQWSYLDQPIYTFLSIVSVWTIISPIINFTSYFTFRSMPEEEFDREYNKKLVFLRKFNNINLSTCIGFNIT